MNTTIPNSTHSNASGSYQAWSSNGRLAVLRDGDWYLHGPDPESKIGMWSRGQMQNFMWIENSYYRVVLNQLHDSSGAWITLEDHGGVWLADEGPFLRCYAQDGGRGRTSAMYDIATTTYWEILREDGLGNLHQVLRWDGGYVFSPGNEHQHISYRCDFDGDNRVEIEGDRPTPGLNRISHPATSGDKMIYVAASGPNDGSVMLLDLHTLQEQLIWTAAEISQAGGRYQHAHLVGEWVVMSVWYRNPSRSTLLVGNISTGNIIQTGMGIDHEPTWAHALKPSMVIIDGTAHIAYQHRDDVKTVEVKLPGQSPGPGIEPIAELAERLRASAKSTEQLAGELADRLVGS